MFFGPSLSYMRLYEISLPFLQLPEKKIVRQAIGQLFNNAKSLEKAGHDGTGKFTINQMEGWFFSEKQSIWFSGLFGLYSILNHSCISNAKCSVGQSCQGYPLEVRAQVEIRAGDEITTRYVGVNIGLPQRSGNSKRIQTTKVSFRCGYE